MSNIITIRIDEETKRKIKKYKINISKVVRSALRREIKKKEKQVLKERVREARKILSKLS